MKYEMPRRVKKYQVRCTNGPMAGETLYLSYDGLDMELKPYFRTAVFTYRGETGRYINGEWQACVK